MSEESTVDVPASQFHSAVATLYLMRASKRPMVKIRKAPLRNLLPFFPLHKTYDYNIYRRS